MVEIKRVSYSYNSLLEGSTPYYLDCLVQRGDTVLVNLHQAFKNKEEFDEEIGKIIPMLEEGREDERGIT